MSELLPCSNCGRELFDDGDETTAEMPEDYEFGGEQATREVPALQCPECGEVTPL